MPSKNVALRTAFDRWNLGGLAYLFSYWLVKLTRKSFLIPEKKKVVGVLHGIETVFKEKLKNIAKLKLGEQILWHYGLCH